MQIGFDAKRAFANRSGLGNYSRYTINALCRYFPEENYFLYAPSPGARGLFEVPEGAVAAYPDRKFPLSKGYWRTFGLAKRLVRDGIQLFHGLSNEIPVGLQNTPVRSVVTIHDLIFLRYPDLYRSADRWIYQAKAKYAVSHADRIIAISNQTKNDIVELLGTDEERIRILYQGCNPWFTEVVPPPEKKRIREKYNLPDSYALYVGTIEKRKNLLDIIRAIHESSIDIALVAIGRKTAYFKSIEEYIARHRVRHVHIIHEIDNHDLPAIYQQAEVFIYPSSYEGFGIPVLEALNSGIPVITSRGGCLEETVGKGGLLVEPGNIDELGESIRLVLQESELRSRLIRAGGEHAKKFREETTTPELYKIYEECMK